MGGEKLLQYDIRHDRFEQDEGYIALQLQTHLKERFNVLVSTITYEIRDGHLVGEGRQEPAVYSIRRGRDHIQRVSPNPVDFARENAEVDAFAKEIDPFFTDSQTPIGSKKLVVSLRGDEGSKYQHNFYDIFSLRYLDGQRVVEMSRYSSALNSQEYVTRLTGYNSDNPPTAAEWLRNPITISNIFVTAEQIHEALHEEHEYMTPSDFEEIWEAVQPVVGKYLFRRDANSFNAILNFADKVWMNNKKKQAGEAYREYKGYIPSEREIQYLGIQKVRQVATACPGKSGADESPWSVSQFGLEEDKYGSRTFACPACGKTNIRPKNEMLAHCQHCGSESVGCKEPVKAVQQEDAKEKEVIDFSKKRQEKSFGSAQDKKEERKKDEKKAA